jgi:signal recognition particle receptor subunit beta
LQLNHAQRELTVKIVYYGPGLSGKTTNLQMIHARSEPQMRGRLLSVETHDDRTLFFDLLPMFFRSSSGFKVKVKLFTVPGQVIHNATRRVVLQGADAVAFIADSRRSATLENSTYWKDLQQSLLDAAGPEGARIPMVIQFNKRDLPDTRSDAEIAEFQRRGNEPVFSAVAIRGQGVLETFHAVLRAAYKSMDARANIAHVLGLSESEFIGQIFSQLDLTGSAFEGQYKRAAKKRGGTEGAA